MINKDIRTEIYKHGVRQWEVADVLGIHEVTLSRKLRHELSDEEKERILEAIEEIGGKHDDK